MTLHERIIQAISEVVHEPVHDDSDLHGFGDGLVFFEIIDRVEQAFDFEITDAESENLKTADHLIKLVETRCSEPV